MQRILTIAVLVLGASILMAADPPASSSDKSPANPSAIGASASMAVASPASSSSKSPANPSANPQANPPAVPRPAGPVPQSDRQYYERHYDVNYPNESGLLYHTLGGWKFEEKTGVLIQVDTQIGITTNNTIQRGHVSCTGLVGGVPSPAGCTGAQPGDANGPIAYPSDADVPNFEGIEMFIQRDIKGNLSTGFSPSPNPTPMYKKFDWGFMADTVYGRSIHGCLTAGYDENWSMNPAAGGLKGFPSTADSANRYNYFCIPNYDLTLWIPVLKGISFRFGHTVDWTSVRNESPGTPQWGPNIFYTKGYEFYRGGLFMGGWIEANIFNNQKMGHLVGDFGVTNGLYLSHSLNGEPMYTYAVRYRSPKMSFWLDYGGRVGYGNVKSPGTCNSITTSALCTTNEKSAWISDALSNYHVFSPNLQRWLEQDVLITKSFNAHWRGQVLLGFAKQYGDGQSIATYSPAAFSPSATNPDGGGLNPVLCSKTLATLNTGGFQTGNPYCKVFYGASYLEYQGVVRYFFTKPKTLSANLRLETFRNPNGFFNGAPNAAIQNTYGPGGAAGDAPIWGGIKGAFNEMSAGLTYNLTRNFDMRPMIRYDWQSGNYYANAFGQNNPNGVTSSTQIFYGVDTILQF